MRRVRSMDGIGRGRLMNMKSAWISGAIALVLLTPAGARQERATTRGAEVRVGIEEGDLRGADHRVLQAAIDQVSGLGGGTVHILPGRYLMRNALTLRDRVSVVGVPGRTILAGCDGARSLLACDGDCRERQITLADSAGFRVGDGVSVRDQKLGGGFEVTTATLVAQVDERTFRLSAPLYLDYLVSQKASAAIAFPIIGGWNVKDVLLEGLTIEGNKENRERLDGCRGGGIYLFESSSVKIRDCVVRNYAGDGISFQVCDDVTVEGCRVEQNTGLGIHPGSGSQRPIVRANVSCANGGDGLYVCWRVKHGVFEKNEIRDNRGVGISIGHKDTDNLFRENSITGNVRTGVLFREESEPMGAHRNTFERNTIVDNGRSEGGKPPKACIILSGQHEGVVFRDNTIGHTGSVTGGAVGISIGRRVGEVGNEGNRFTNVEKDVVREK